jgi:uncharacterized protein YndB with AHSA1/START domain
METSAKIENGIEVQNDLVLTRIFNAVADRVWKAFTDEIEMKKWWGPKGFTAPEVRIDLREGGNFLSCMRGLDGNDLWSTGTYRKIVPEKIIEMSDSFADADGNIVPAAHYGMPGDWPLVLDVRLTFENENGKTKLTLRHRGIPSEILEPCREGWSESFDKLEEILKP